MEQGMECIHKDLNVYNIAMNTNIESLNNYLTELSRDTTSNNSFKNKYQTKILWLLIQQ